jgi:hypothetical protein
MNVIAAHKDELEKLLEDLSSDRMVSGITFVAFVQAYITRLDTNCPDISGRVNPPPAQTDGRLTYGTNIDSKLRALLRATYNFGPPCRAFPGQRPLNDVRQRVNPRMGLKKSVASSKVEAPKQKTKRQHKSLFRAS